MTNTEVITGTSIHGEKPIPFVRLHYFEIIDGKLAALSIMWVYGRFSPSKILTYFALIELFCFKNVSWIRDLTEAVDYSISIAFKLKSRYI